MVNIIKHIKNNIVLLSTLGIAMFSFNVFILRDELILMYDYKRIFSCSIIIITLTTIILSKKVRCDLYLQLTSLNKITVYLLLLLFFLSVLSNSIGLYRIRGFLDLANYTGLFLIALTIASNNNNIKQTFEVYIVITILSFLSVICGFYIALSLEIAPSNFTILSYVNPRILNQVQAWLIIPIIYYSIINNSYLAKIALILNVSIIFALDARGLGIAAFIGVIIWSVLDNTNRKNILKIATYCIIIGLLTKLIILHPLPTIIYLNEYIPMELRSDIGHGRLDVWLQAVNMVSFWGHGGDAFVCNTTSHARPHNSILLVLVNWGVLAAITYVALVLLLLYRIISIRREPLSLALGVTLLSGLGYSLVSGVLDSPFSQLLSCVTLGLFWSTLTKNDTNVNLVNKKYISSILILISILIAIAITVKIEDRITNNHFRGLEYKETPYMPQYWLGNNCNEEKATITR
ncbi:O-antigen ligase family protein [Vibrio breoganii]|uniref:O-antigen ligase family protein n=2 Tax=Vibrio breoganii TaxID=553239 RepID=UPI001F5327AC|nr:O-antigen ligase family protein [Vibrio breoganii]